MRLEMSEPTGMQVRRVQGGESLMEFAEFVAGVARGDIRPEDFVCSRIVTQNQWVRVGRMRLYREIMQEAARERAARENVWPPPPHE